MQISAIIYYKKKWLCKQLVEFILIKKITCLRRPNMYSEIKSVGRGDRNGLGPAIV